MVEIRIFTIIRHNFSKHFIPLNCKNKLYKINTDKSLYNNNLL